MAACAESAGPGHAAAETEGFKKVTPAPFSSRSPQQHLHFPPSLSLWLLFSVLQHS